MIVYGLVDPRTKQIRYVGETTRALKTRLAQHLRASREKTTPPVNAWLRGLEAEGLTPDAIEIESLPSAAEMHLAESFWIEQFSAMGAALLNIAPGGTARGGYRHSEATKQRWRETRRGENHPMFGKRRTEEQREMFRQIGKRVWTERPHPNLGKKRSPETVEKMRAARSGRKISEEHKAALARGAAKNWESPEYRAKMIRSGADNPRARVVVVDGREYTVRQLSEAAGRPMATISRRLKMYEGRELTMADFTWSRLTNRRQAEYAECVK